MPRFNPPRVVLYAPERAYLEQIGHLLTWDRRVHLDKLYTCDADLLAYAGKSRRKPRALRPDVFLVDERTRHLPLAELLSALRAAQPAATVLVLTLDGPESIVATAIAGGARGILIKDEIRYGIASAVLAARDATFVFTPGLEPLLRRSHGETFRVARRLPAWRMCDHVQPRFQHALRLSYLDGLGAARIAAIRNVAESTIHSYCSKGRRALAEASADGWYDTQSLTPFCDELTGDEFAAHLLTCLPAVEW